MSGCCNKNGSDSEADREADREVDREIPEGIDSCCKIRGPRCMCRPYCNGWVITAQVLTIVAFGVSWVWWVTFIISLVGMATFQILWCCRSGKAMIYSFAVIAGVCSLAEVGVGIFALVVLSKAKNCNPFIMYFEIPSDDSYWYNYCNEVAWASVAFVGAAFWAASAICLFVFAWSGQHARLEEKHAKKAGGKAHSLPTNLELVGASLEAKAGPSAEVEEGGEPTIETVGLVSETKKVDLND